MLICGGPCSVGELEDACVQDRPLGQGRPQGAMQAVLQVHVAAPEHDVGEQVAEVGRVLCEQGLQVELALGRHQLFEPHLGRCQLAPLALAEAVVGVRLVVTQAPEDHVFEHRLAPPRPARWESLMSAKDGADAQPDVVASVQQGYSFDGPALELGALVVDGKARPDAPVRIPLAMVNRHGLVAGATGTGKTKTLQLMAEQLSAAGVPVFLADVKGDLSGMAAPGTPGERVTTRAREIGYDWQPASYPVEFFALGGHGTGVPVRSTVTSFGPTLLAKVF